MNNGETDTRRLPDGSATAYTGHMCVVNHVILLVPLSLLGSIDKKCCYKQTGESEQPHQHRAVHR